MSKLVVDTDSLVEVSNKHGGIQHLIEKLQGSAAPILSNAGTGGAHPVVHNAGSGHPGQDPAANANPNLAQGGGNQTNPAAAKAGAHTASDVPSSTAHGQYVEHERGHGHGGGSESGGRHVVGNDATRPSDYMSSIIDARRNEMMNSQSK